MALSCLFTSLRLVSVCKRVRIACALISNKNVLMRICTEKITFLFQDLFNTKPSVAKRKRYERGNPERKYDVRKELGSGAFATVKLAIERLTGQPYAIKVLDKKKVAMASYSKRDTIQDEIELLSQVRQHLAFSCALLILIISIDRSSKHCAHGRSV